jgi:hypothetical protein
MTNLVSIDELRRMVNDAKDLVGFYHKKVMDKQRDVELLEDALKSRLKSQKQDKKQ